MAWGCGEGDRGWLKGTGSLAGVCAINLAMELAFTATSAQRFRQALQRHKIVATA